jgi:ParB family chromosome partitioning protein
VIAGGRRLAALKILSKRKLWAKDALVPCQTVEGDNLTEISLAENALQCPMHPADQFEAFAELHRQDLNVEDIAARFGVTPQIVTQRLKLGAVSKRLLKLYRAGEMNLEQLSAFTITDNYNLQERVWGELGYNKSRRAILEALNEGQVSTDDRRALYVGAETYLAAGGHITRDLFDEEGGGFCDDATLLNRLASEKLAIEAEAVSAEGWKWVAVEIEFDYGMAAGLRRIYPMPRQLTEADEARIAELEDRYETLCDEWEGKDSAQLEPALNEIDCEVESIRGREVYAPAEMAIAGAFVSLGHGRPATRRTRLRSPRG